MISVKNPTIFIYFFVKKVCVGVVDSGIGGLAFLRLCKKNVDCNFVFVMDNAFCPYGEKSPQMITNRIQKICKFLFEEKNVDAIVLACNTATSVAIESLRKTFDRPIIGMEPPIKMAIDEDKKNIVVMSTPVTNKFSKVAKRFEDKVVFASFPTLAKDIENNFFDRDVLSEKIRRGFEGIDTKKCDALVLGCSHFQYVEKQICKNFCEGTKVFHSEQGVLRRLVQILGENSHGTCGKIAIFQTQYDESLLKIAKEILCN